ncbi:MAG: ABC transporter ATP-binding protein [Pseudomonadota bacterium]|nr:ABC transporter ATP-binding protein [Pseudomonadota bacterium]
MRQTILSICDLSKTFGGVVATDDLSLDIEQGELHAIIGPNGAGKTTLIAQLSGEIFPDNGRIVFQEKNITMLPPYKRSHLGIARSFQITSLMLEMNVIDNVALATQANEGHSYKFWKSARDDLDLRQSAMHALKEVGLEGRKFEKVQNLSHGEHRQLEIAMALATQPHLLLLDEPMAGMGAEEGKKILKILKKLKKRKTILLIEHDMDVVFALADRITVLVYGRAIASGSPQSIKADERVREAYLGTEGDLNC